MKFKPAPTLFGGFTLPKIRTYRIPYQGSKNAIATQIIAEILTRTTDHAKRRFVDAFCGGGGILYGVSETGMFQSVLGNDIQSELIDLHRNLPDLDLDYIARTPCLLRPNPVAQERYPFLKLIDQIEPMYQMAFRIVYSFGNDCRTNLWGDDMLVKYEIGYNLFHYPERIADTLAKFIGTDAVIPMTYAASGISGRYDEYKRHLGLYRAKIERCQIQPLASIEALSRTQALQALQALQAPTFTSLSYDQIEYTERDVVYFDPPYRSTKDYTASSFDNDQFEDFARSLKVPVFISEYQPEIKGFQPILRIPKRGTMAAKSNSLVHEYLHWNGLK